MTPLEYGMHVEHLRKFPLGSLGTLENLVTVVIGQLAGKVIEKYELMPERYPARARKEFDKRRAEQAVKPKISDLYDQFTRVYEEVRDEEWQQNPSAADA